MSFYSILNYSVYNCPQLGLMINGHNLQSIGYILKVKLLFSEAHNQLIEGSEARS